ncbi:MAG: hypothetical protein QXL18_05230 [Candidatus Woesearchaeota archaeon]
MKFLSCSLTKQYTIYDGNESIASGDKILLMLLVILLIFILLTKISIQILETSY